MKAVANTTTRSRNGSQPKPRRGGGGGGSGSGAGLTGVAATNAPASVSVVATQAFIIDGVDTDAVAVPRSPAEKKRALLQTRLHPSLLAVVDRLKDKRATANADEAKFTRDGKAEIQIWLTDKSVENLAKLKELGFEVVLDPKSAKLVIGRLPIDKLEALAELSFVRYLSPQVLNN